VSPTPKIASGNWPDVTTFTEAYDCLLLDLDGTVFRGHEPTEGALDALDGVGVRKLFVTNNASRSAPDVAKHLCELGFTAVPDDVVTSAQSAASLLARQLPAGSRVLVIGTEALAAEVKEVGLQPVRRFDEDPVAVVQGHSAETGWAQLAEAALAIRAGALWVAANIDKTLPSERGLLPGNGSMVAALRTATDVEPQVAGKPGPALMSDALARGQFDAPLVVGDRLDTDIAGAHAAGLPSLMVLTGVSSARDAVFANADERPDFIAPDLRCLLEPTVDVVVAPHPAWAIEIDPYQVMVTSTGAPAGDDGLSVVRATAHAVWGSGVRRVAAGDDAARAALQRWALLDGADRLA